MGRDWLRGGDAGERENLKGMISQVIFFTVHWSGESWLLKCIKSLVEGPGPPF